MNRVIVVFVANNDGPLPAKESAIVYCRDLLIRLNNRDHTPLPNFQGDQKAAPFWTWFIENPRTCGG